MPYQSPIHILAHFESGMTDLNPQGIRRLQQKIMAEFALDNKQTLFINKHSYSKDDLLKTIDRLKEGDYAEIQQKLFGNKLALRFLENEEEQCATRFVKQFFDSLKSEPGFRFLQEPISTALSQHLKINVPLYQFKYCANCLDLINLLTIDQQQEVYKQIVPPLQEYIDNLKYEFILMNKQIMEKSKMNGGEIINYSNLSIISNPIAILFNQLPSQFYVLKSDYVNACLEFVRKCITMGNSAQKVVGQLVSELKKINELDANLSRKIDNYHSRFVDGNRLSEIVENANTSNNQSQTTNEQTEQQTDKDANDDNAEALPVKIFMAIMILVGINYDSVFLVVMASLILIALVREGIKKKKKKKRA